MSPILENSLPTILITDHLILMPNKIKLFLRQLPLEHETSLFILISGADLFMTYILLRRGEFREMNPLAAYALKHWNVTGMVCLKFATVTIICVIAQMIALREEKYAQSFLRCATALISIVVLYSFTLLVRSLW